MPILTRLILIARAGISASIFYYFTHASKGNGMPTNATYTYPVHFRPSHIDPVDLGALDEWDVYRAIHDKLFVTESGKGIFEGVIAESWLFEQQKQRLSVTIKEGIKFSDGSRISVDDVIFSIKRKILLTFAKNPVLPACMGIKKPVLSINGEINLPQIRKVDSRRFEMDIIGCDQGILEELSGTNFAIVKKSEVGSDFKLKQVPIVSGAFQYAINSTEGEMYLQPNTKNGRYLERKIRQPFSIKIVPYSKAQEAINDIKPRVDLPDFLKVTSPDLFEKLSKSGYKHVMSVPNTAVILSLLPLDPKTVSKNERDTLTYIEKKFDREKIVREVGGHFYSATNQLFPPDMNCSADSQSRDLRSETQVIPSKIIIELVSRDSNPNANKLFQSIKANIESMGFRVLGPSAHGNEDQKMRVKIMITGQHLGLRPVEVVNLMVGQLQQVPDPGNRMKKIISESMTISDKDQAAKIVCNEFHHFNHFPILHRRTAFMAKDEKLLTVFSPVTAAVHLEKMIEILGEK